MYRESAQTERSEMATPLVNLAGKVAIVTGSSSGIGLSAAAILARLGAKVTLSGRNLEGLEEAKKACLTAGAKESDICSVAGELTDENTRERLISETIKQFGKLDVLVNNAGVCPTSCLALGNANLQTFDKIFDLNVRALIDLTMKAVPELVKTKGNIVNISSVGGIRPVPGFIFYGMAKCSVEFFSRALAQELGPKGVRVNTIAPGAVRTNLPVSAGLSKEAAAGYYSSESAKDKQVIGRVGEPEDLGNLIAFLASDAASFITGGNYVCDGGYLLAAQQNAVEQQTTKK